jgi:hypothetical protein
MVVPVGKPPHRRGMIRRLFAAIGRRLSDFAKAAVLILAIGLGRAGAHFSRSGGKAAGRLFRRRKPMLVLTSVRGLGRAGAHSIESAACAAGPSGAANAVRTDIAGGA